MCERCVKTAEMIRNLKRGQVLEIYINSRKPPRVIDYNEPAETIETGESDVRESHSHQSEQAEQAEA